MTLQQLAVLSALGVLVALLVRSKHAPAVVFSGLEARVRLGSTWRRGNYTLADFVRAGLPVTVAYLVTAMVAIPVFFPLTSL